VEYKKSYKTNEEEEMRKLIYEMEVDKVNAHNDKFLKGEVHYFLGINTFSDVTEDEMGDMTGRPKFQHPFTSKYKEMFAADAADTDGVSKTGRGRLKDADVGDTHDWMTGDITFEKDSMDKDEWRKDHLWQKLWDPLHYLMPGADMNRFNSRRHPWPLPNQVNWKHRLEDFFKEREKNESHVIKLLDKWYTEQHHGSSLDLNFPADFLKHMAHSVPEKTLDGKREGIMSTNASCFPAWAYVAVDTIIYHYIIKFGLDDMTQIWDRFGTSNWYKHLGPASYQQLLDCVTPQYGYDQYDAYGCMGGKYWEGWRYIINLGPYGLRAEQMADGDGGYKNRDPRIEDLHGQECKVTLTQCGPDPDNKKAWKCPSLDPGPFATMSSMIQIPPSEMDLKLAVATQGPVAVLVDTWGWKNYQGGIFDGSDCYSQPYQNAIVIGYSFQKMNYGIRKIQERDHWVVQVSWGPHWGQNGYIYIRSLANKMYTQTHGDDINLYRFGLCNIAMYAMIPVVERGGMKEKRWNTYTTPKPAE